MTKTVFLSLIAVLGFTGAAHADGFVCDATHESLRVRVYHRTDARQGTRNVAVMVVSDPSRPAGQRTLYRFEADHDRLSNNGARYTAQVMVPEIALSLSSQDNPFFDRPNIQGIQFGQIQEISLEIDFSYRLPIASGERVAGVLELYQLNGDQLWVDMDCERYLKGSNGP